MAETKSLLKTRTTKSGTVGSNPTLSANFSVPGPDYGRTTFKNPVYLFLTRHFICIYPSYAQIKNDSSIRISLQY